MRIGVVCRGDMTGIAVQSWSFCRNMKTTAVLIVNLSRYGVHHRCDSSRYGGMGQIFEWDAPHFLHVASHPEDILDDFLSEIDVLFVVETPYNYWLFERARERGIRIVLQPNPEFFDYSQGRELPLPDVFALPTTWYEAQIRQDVPNSEVIVLPVPVDRELIPYRHRTELKSILHTAGTVAQPDRNGSAIVIEAMRLVDRPITARICHQGPLDVQDVPESVTIDTSAPHNYWELYGDEDLYVMPRRFGGLCLPMQEAFANGMPALMSNAAPQNEWLPASMMVDAPVDGTLQCRYLLNLHNASPTDVAARLEWFYDHPEEIDSMSLWVDEWAQQWSWDTLKDTYEAVLRGE